MEVKRLPHALQIVLPMSSRRQRGVALVPQFAQLIAPTGANLALNRGFELLDGSSSGDNCWAVPYSAIALEGATLGSVGPGKSSIWGDSDLFLTRLLLRFAIVCRLLKVGQPAQAEVPPVPLQRPSPGHVPFGCWVSATGWRVGEEVEEGLSSESGGEIWSVSGRDVRLDF